jgi:hypothetical protein
LHIKLILVAGDDEIGVVPERQAIPILNKSPEGNSLSFQSILFDVSFNEEVHLFLMCYIGTYCRNVSIPEVFTAPVRY